MEKLLTEVSKGIASYLGGLIREAFQKEDYEKRLEELGENAGKILNECIRMLKSPGQLYDKVKELSDITHDYLVLHRYLNGSRTRSLVDALIERSPDELLKVAVDLSEAYARHFKDLNGEEH